MPEKKCKTSGKSVKKSKIADFMPNYSKVKIFIPKKTVNGKKVAALDIHN